MAKKIIENLLHKELSYLIHGAAIEVRKDFGPGHKEKLYQKAFSEELKRKNIKFEKEKSIKIYSPKDGKLVGSYRPDFVVEEKIIIETKAEKFVRQDEIKRIYDYLRNSQYELAYFINFASPQLYVRRIIYTNDRKPLKKLLVFISFILVSFSGLLFSGLFAQAAVLTPTAERTEYKIGDTFIVDLRLDSQGEYINALEVKVKFDPKILRAEDFSRGNSIISLWLSEPVISNADGTIVFSGGVPNGFEGDNGFLGEVIFKAVAAGESEIEFLTSSRLFLNDGRGTPADLSVKKFRIKISQGGVETEKTIDEWQEKIKEDQISPESFKVYFNQEPGVFNNQYYLIFFTTDKQTGVDYYQVKEGDLPWQKAESPYLLKDQSLAGAIQVKATDKADNERIEVIYPQELGFSSFKESLIKIIILIAILLILCYFLIKLLKSKKVKK